MRRTYEKAEIVSAHGAKVVLSLKAEHDDEKPDVTLSYELEDGQAGITIRTVFENKRTRPEPVNILLDGRVSRGRFSGRQERRKRQ